ncbi:MAG: gamma-glutamyl-gamma-aminobutyrate hydrolase family protein [Oscillospiraceae bacterium]|nr:gamma-glutamyl-gamma-aminobutyrate hydrolase family protein [Oscillospiraceae bacterium]
MSTRILISGKLNLENYIDAIAAAGGTAVGGYLPEIDLSCDGLLLCGGVDIHPNYYNEDINGSVDIDDARDTAEFALIKAFVEAGKPVFGVCRGCQLMNVYFGGSLHQHMFNTVLHRSGATLAREHDVVAAPDSVFASMYGSRFVVNSIHHQAVKTLGSDLEATMWSDDGIVEGFAHKHLPVFAVQWHPERLIIPEQRRHAVDGVKIFSYFIDMCNKKKLGE